MWARKWVNWYHIHIWKQIPEGARLPWLGKVPDCVRTSRNNYKHPRQKSKIHNENHPQNKPPNAINDILSTE